MDKSGPSAGAGIGAGAVVGVRVNGCRAQAGVGIGVGVSLNKNGLRTHIGPKATAHAGCSNDGDDEEQEDDDMDDESEDAEFALSSLTFGSAAAQNPRSILDDIIIGCPHVPALVLRQRCEPMPARW